MKETVTDLATNPPTKQRKFEIGSDEAISIYLARSEEGRETISVFAVGDSGLRIESQIISLTSVNGKRNGDIPHTLIPPISEDGIKGSVVFGTNDRKGNEFIFVRENTKDPQ